MTRFALSADPLHPAALRARLACPATGALTVFEGRVRNEHAGRGVQALEYEAYEPLAAAEGERVLSEAEARWPGVRCAAVHRTGRLEVEDVAVWIGAAAPHRDAAFQACRFIIDAFKERLPLWKKEHYAGEATEWLESPEGRPPRREELFARQIALGAVGAGGQERLAQTRAAVVGAGGLGCAAIAYLSRAGVGEVRVWDNDVVETSNLHRQPFYGMPDRGRPKADVVAARWSRPLPGSKVSARQRRITPENMREELGGCGVIFDCSDNAATKLCLNQTAFDLDALLISASVEGLEGQLLAVDPGTPGCLACLWKGPLGEDRSGAPVLGPVPAVLGAMQALEGLKHLLDLPGRLRNEIVYYDGLGQRMERMALPREADCPVCGG